MAKKTIVKKKRTTFGFHMVGEALYDLGEELIHWARTNENAIKIQQFAFLKGIPIAQFTQYAERDEKFSNYYEEAKAIIGLRRFNLLCAHNPAFMGRTQMIYDGDEKKAFEIREAAKKDANSHSAEEIARLMIEFNKPLKPAEESNE